MAQPRESSALPAPAVTSGGTESVLQSMYTARQNFPDAPFFFSKESHYCVYKAARMMGVEKVEINTQEGGEIDYGELREALRKNREAGRKAVVNLNVGTTVRGAIDDIDKVAAILEETGNKREDFFINADAALVSEGARAVQMWRLACAL